MVLRTLITETALLNDTDEGGMGVFPERQRKQKLESGSGVVPTAVDVGVFSQSVLC